MQILKNDRNIEEKATIVYLTTYPPRECGLATFSADLINYSDELFLGKVDTKVVAMNTGQSDHKYSDKVLFEISQNNKDEYINIAERLNNMPEVGLVCVQHEFGIFGDNYGENLILFLDKLEKPVAVTFHTVLPSPEDGMLLVMKKIIEHTDKLIVMTELSQKILVDIYGAQIEKIKVIPHGIHPQLYTDASSAKDKLGFKDKRVLTTFGFLGRGKGIEYAIKSLPEIVKKYPDTLYLILGETHPVVRKNEGEAYRDELVALSTELGVEKNVVFYNKYLSTEDLLDFLQATDIYLALSQNPDQAVSGTLTYALGAGRAVVSTPFMQAKELVTSEVGLLVSFNDYESITRDVLRLFDDKNLLVSMGKSAYFRTRNMTWPNVAHSYMSAFASLLPSISEKNKRLLPIKFGHVKKLTDDFGILQFASLHNPLPEWGYTIDDNARALVVMSWYSDTKETNKEVENLADVFLSFIERASKEDGGFFNYFTIDKNPHDELNKNENLEDADARALWALSVAGTSNMRESLKFRAKELFKKQFGIHENIISPRAAAFYIKAFALHTGLDDEIKEEALRKVQFYADFLVDLFERSSDGEWKWFEESLTYSNALLPEALLVAYTVNKNPMYLEKARTSLDFLLEQFFEGDVCVPVGQAGWFKKGGQKERYDQQAEEVSALVLALQRMFSITGDSKYSIKMTLAFDWFLGNNLSNQVVYTHFTGGCYDGLIKGGMNLNQGAESTLSYLLARLVVGRQPVI